MIKKIAKPTDKIDFFVGNKDLEILPHDNDTERKVLSLLMISPDVYDEFHKYLAPDGMFYGVWEAEIWQIITGLAQSNIPPDLQSVQAVLNSQGRGRDAMELQGLTAGAIGYAHKIKIYCLRLNEYWVRRTVHRFGWYLNTKALDTDYDPLDLLGKVSEGTGKIFQHIGGMNERTNEEAGADLLQQIIKMQEGTRYGLRSSIPELDAITRGYQNSELTIIAAGTGEGKSTLAFQEIDYQASNGHPIGVLLLEMTQAQMILLIACAREKIDVRKVRTPGALSIDELNRLGTAVGKVKKLPIYALDTPGLRLGEAKATIRKWKKQHGIQAAYVDHIHLMKHDNATLNPEQSFTAIANDLKNISKELDMPVIGLAQLARRDSKEKTRKHESTDLKYAGGIEQAADCIIMVYRWEKHGMETDKDGNSMKGKALIQITKMRMMEPKDIPVKFTGQKFLDYSDPEARDQPTVTFENPRAGISATKYDEPAPF